MAETRTPTRRGPKPSSYWQPGDQPPSGYIAWHSWADAQHKAGLRQARCGQCALWKFPQELSSKELVSKPFDSKGRVHEHRSRVYSECVAKR